MLVANHIDLFIDFAKAFDKVSHCKLCHKSSHYRINVRILHRIKTLCCSYLKELRCASGTTVLAPLSYLYQ